MGRGSIGECAVPICSTKDVVNGDVWRTKKYRTPETRCIAFEIKADQIRAIGESVEINGSDGFGNGDADQIGTRSKRTLTYGGDGEVVDCGGDY